jgi:hypothetical protein
MVGSEAAAPAPGSLDSLVEASKSIQQDSSTDILRGNQGETEADCQVTQDLIAEQIETLETTMKDIGNKDIVDKDAQDQKLESTDVSELGSAGDGPQTPSKPVMTDISNSPTKKKSLWIIIIEDLLAHTIPRDNDVPLWFSEMVGSSSEPTSIKVQSIIGVEQQNKKRFPKSQPMAPEMVEFLAHTMVRLEGTPIYHPNFLFANATVLPLVYFSNLVFSKALLINMAGCSFKSSKPRNKSQHQEPLRLWRMGLPPCEDKQHTYQCWLVHLKGRNGSKYKKIQTKE